MLMSLPLGLECALCLGSCACARWAWRRCTHSGTHDSASWPTLSSPSDFSPIPRACRHILAAYEPDPTHPLWSHHPIPPSSLLKRVSESETLDRSPPYLIFADPASKEIVLALRGLNLARDADYRTLLDSGSATEVFDGGYVHRGLLKSAVWVLNREADTLARLMREYGEEYGLVIAGHSLGAGVAALMAVVVVNYLDRFGGIERRRVRCYAAAPARCMSLDLAVKYADVIHSVVLQDDFLPRTPTPLEHIFGSIFCLPCLLFLVCMRDTFISEEKKLKDPRRLYAPGRMYHIVERKPCSCGRFPPEVRTAIPVEGRFEHIVLSCNAIFDHSIIWIEREAQKALETMEENAGVTSPPMCQKMERELSPGKEHRDAMERAVILDVPHAVAPNEESSEENKSPVDEISTCSGSSRRSEWDELVEKLFDEEESENLVLKQDIGAKL